MRGTKAKALRQEFGVMCFEKEDRRYVVENNRLGLTEMHGNLVKARMPGTVANAPDTPRAAYQKAKRNADNDAM